MKPQPLLSQQEQTAIQIADIDQQILDITKDTGLTIDE